MTKIKKEDWKPTNIALDDPVVDGWRVDKKGRRYLSVPDNAPTVSVEVGEDGDLWGDKLNEALEKERKRRETLPPEWAALKEKYADICMMWQNHIDDAVISVNYHDSDWDSSGAEFDIDDIEYAIECLEHAKWHKPTDELLKKFSKGGIELIKCETIPVQWRACYQQAPFAMIYIGIGATPNEALNNLNKEVKNAN